MAAEGGGQCFLGPSVPQRRIRCLRPLPQCATASEPTAAALFYPVEGEKESLFCSGGRLLMWPGRVGCEGVTAPRPSASDRLTPSPRKPIYRRGVDGLTGAQLAARAERAHHSHACMRATRPGDEDNNAVMTPRQRKLAGDGSIHYRPELIPTDTHAARAPLWLLVLLAWQ